MNTVLVFGTRPGPITGLFLNPARRAALGAAARTRVEQEFSVGRMTERAAALYDGLIRSRSVRGKSREASRVS